jgi:hypothetical protein
MTTIYLIDTHNVYIGQQTLADLMAPLPACVLQEPPALQGQEVARWYGSGWEVLPQHPAAESTGAVAERVVAAIKAERDHRAQTGGFKVGTKWYHSDTFSRTQQMGLVMLGSNIPSGTQWKTMDGSFIAMTPTLAGQIFAAAAASDIATFAAAEAHIAAVTASQDPASYDFSQGWPQIYQP